MTRTRAEGDVPEWVQGVWRRDRVEHGDGSVDRDTTVIWLQTPTLYADIRLPGRSHKAPVQGFAGWLAVSGRVCAWHRPIDLQPPAPTPDVGTMFRRGRRMIECGVHANYLEDWRLIDDGGGRFLAMACGGRRMSELLVMAGDHFMIAERGHRRGEISYGRIDPRTKDWRIELSTRSRRRRRPLFAGEGWRFDLGRGTALQEPEGGGSPRRWRLWSCTLAPRQLSPLFPSER